MFLLLKQTNTWKLIEISHIRSLTWTSLSLASRARRKMRRTSSQVWTTSTKESSKRAFRSMSKKHHKAQAKRRGRVKTPKIQPNLQKSTKSLNSFFIKKRKRAESTKKVVNILNQLKSHNIIFSHLEGLIRITKMNLWNLRSHRYSSCSGSLQKMERTVTRTRLKWELSALMT